MITVSIEDNASPALRSLADKLTRRKPLHARMATAVHKDVQNRFRGLASSNRNKFGARGGFWRRMLSGTRASADETAGTISMPREVAQRFYGGTIRPVNAKNLAIPADKESYGKRPGEFAGKLHVAILGGRAALVENLATRISISRAGKVKSKGSTGKVLFWLVKSVTQKPNPAVLPSEAQIGQIAAEAAEKYFAEKK